MLKLLSKLAEKYAKRTNTACAIVWAFHKTKMPAFMMEGIATYLSKQNLLAKGVAKIDCSGADLMQNFYNTPNAYGYSGLVAEYLDKTKTHKQMLEILKEPHKVDANVLVQETNLFLQKNRVKNLKICDKSV